jgi:hypothetical protein
MDESPVSVKVYKYRWIILLIFCLYSAINFLQFLQYSIIANITAKYYDVDDTLVDLTGLMFMICFIIFCLPINFLIEKYVSLTVQISTDLYSSTFPELEDHRYIEQRLDNSRKLNQTTVSFP